MSNKEKISLKHVDASVMRKHGKMGRRKIKLPIEEIISRQQQGENPKDLGEDYGVSESTIRNRLTEAGVEFGSRGRNKIELPMNEIMERYLSFEDEEELAIEFGVTPITIIKRLQEAGVQTRISIWTKNIINHRISGEVADLLEVGASINTLCVVFNVTPEFIFDLLYSEEQLNYSAN